MRILCYEHSGFCSGVRRAVEIALDLAKKDEKVFTLGPLVHNEEVEKLLSSKGVKMVSSPDEVDKGNLIIRTHGEGPGVFDIVSGRPEITLHDATCPRVKKVQNLASKLTEENNQVVVWGKPDHPEVESIVKWTGNKAIVVSTIPELSKKQIRAPAALLSQTTQERSTFEGAARRFKTIFSNAQVYDTLCPTVKRLQNAAEKMANQVDLMIVIGSPVSSNTEKLLRLCIRKTPTYRISGAHEISARMFRGIGLVGVIAGASTPDWIIKEVLKKMEEVKNEEMNGEIKTEEEKEIKLGEATDELKTEKEEVTIEPIAETNEPKDALQAETQTECDAPVEEPQAEAETPVDEPQAEAAKPVDEPQVEAEAPVDRPKTLEEIKAELKEDLMVDNNKGEVEENVDSNFYFLDEIKSFQEGDVASGSVVKVDEDSVMVDLGDKTEALLPCGEVFLRDGETLAGKFPIGTKLEVLVIKVNDQEGLVEVSHRRQERQTLWDNLEKALSDEVNLTGKVKAVVSAGMIVDLGAGIEGFMPGSLVDVRYIPDFNEYLGQEISFKIIEINRDKDKVIVSRRKYIEETNAVKKQDIFKNLSEGDIVDGIVRRLTKFGAFVDIGGIDGLVHISEISWGRVNRPEDVLNVGDEIKVKVLQLIPEKEKISLSIRRTQPDPWDLVTRQFKIGQITKGTVTRLAKFGAFIEIVPGVEGLAHVSQVADFHVKHPSEVLKEGATIDIKILDLRPEDKRISLSVKEANPVSTDTKAYTQSSSDNGSGVTLGDVFGELFNNGNKEEATEEVATEEVAAEEATTEEVAAIEEVATDEVETTEEVAAEEATTEEVAAIEEVATDEVETTEEVAAEEATTEEVAAIEEVATDEVETAEEVTSEEATTEDIATEEEIEEETKE